MKNTVCNYLTEHLELDPETTEMLYESFAETVSGQLESGRRQMAENDFPGLRRSAHTIKGCAANVGAVEISSAAQTLENAAAAADAAGCAAAFRTLESVTVEL